MARQFVFYPYACITYYCFQISGKAELNEVDKAYNKELAEALVARGIHYVVQDGEMEEE